MQLNQIGAEQAGNEDPVTVEFAQPEPAAQWNLSQRIAFRFCVVYFTLYCLSNQILSGLLRLPNYGVPGMGGRWPLRPLTLWTAAHVFHFAHPLDEMPSGSGDKSYDWVLTFCMLALAAAIAVLWSILDRRRKNYAVFHKWFRLWMRFALAAQMLSYGFAKVIPLQMPFPLLSRLVEPYGSFSPMAVLWSSIGTSPPYEIFTGCAEALGGLLLLTPRTATFGALVCLADMIQVFMLNMTYDVPVKLLSFHLILFSLFLLAPDIRRIISFFFTNRVTGPSVQPALFRRAWPNRIAVILQVAFGLYLVTLNITGGITRWRTVGGGRPKPSLYGIWNVEQMSVDGVVRSPLLTDYGRWRRVIFDFVAFAHFQRMDDSFAIFGSAINDKERTIALTRPADKNWKASFTFNRPAPGQLVLDGTMDGHKISMQLKLLDREKFTLVNRGFHWTTEVPFQR